MVWFDKLKELIKINLKLDFSNFININITKNSNNKLDMKKGHYFDETEKILHLNPDELPPQISEEITQAAKKYIEEGNCLLEYNSKKLLERLYDYNKNNPSKAILSFFKPIIPPPDFEALEASLFLRSRFIKDEPVYGLKNDIRKRFGDRGNNISNLCTAGYFEEFLMPLYNQSKDDFKKIYNDIVERSIVAVFVHKSMSVQDIPSEIENRIKISKKYGIKFIHIHGISNENVEKIKDCIEEKRDYFDFFNKTIYENEEKNLIIVELLFK